ncbi:uncharacterized protein [Anabrus simplex]|uniref:uncharacterized protein n=1 Tax=Anabrus simplex TaxID=316456 RepID=UPI0035A3D3D6
MVSLVANYGSSSDSGSDTDSNCDIDTEKHLSSTVEKLPGPEFGTGTTSTMKTSVFSNPFAEAEMAKKAILEKHVKMTPTKDETKMINGRKICWNFRKGRCRFGHKCKFAHDSDLHAPISEEQDGSDVVNSTQFVLVSPNAAIPIVENELSNSSESTNLGNKMKRPGIHQTLIPGKKVMKLLKRQKGTGASWVM